MEKVIEQVLDDHIGLESVFFLILGGGLSVEVRSRGNGKGLKDEWILTAELLILALSEINLTYELYSACETGCVIVRIDA